MTDFLNYVFSGIPQGCVFALVAIGLVLIYKTTGVFNLAFGAQAFLSAAVFYKLGVDWKWPKWAAFVVAVLVLAPAFGWFLDRAIFRHLRTAPWQVKLVSALGFVIAIPELVKLKAEQFPAVVQPLMRALPVFLGPAQVYNPPGLVPNGQQNVDSIGGIDVSRFGITRDELAVIVVTVVVVVALALMFRYTAIGLQMRAVVESPRMVELAGVDADRVSMVAWMLSSLLAGLAGVLLVPLWATVDGNNFTILIVTAIAAAAIGKLTSIPRTLVGGVALGVLIALFAGYGDTILHWFTDDNDLVQQLKGGIRPAIPFVLLFLVLVFMPSLRDRRELTDPLSGVDPPPPALASTQLEGGMKRLNRMVFIGFLTFIVLFVLVEPSIDFRGQQLLGFTGPIWTKQIIYVLCFATIFLSITAFTGLSGQISLATATFAGIGAFLTGNLAGRHGMDVVLAIIVGALVSLLIGALLAVPALRLGGIFLTLATLAFGLFFSNVIFPLESVSQQSGTGVISPRPIFAPSDRAFFFFAFAVFALAGFLVILVRRGTTGGFLSALRGSEVAAASIGINGTVARIVLFALASFIAGLGGGLYSSALNVRLDTTEFEALFSILFVVLVLNAAPRTVDGSVNAAVGFVVFLAFLSQQLGLPVGLGIIAFGLGAITYARHPEGVAEFQKRLSVQRFLERRRVEATTRRLEREGHLPDRVRDPRQVVAFSVATLGFVYPTVMVSRWYNELREERGRGLGGSFGLMVYLPLRIVGAVTLVAILTNTDRMSNFALVSGDPAANVLNVIVLVLACGFLAPFSLTAFVLLQEVVKLYEQYGMKAPFTWKAGLPVVLFPLVIVVAAPQATGDIPTPITYFGTFVMLILGISAALSWLSGVQSAMNRYYIARSEGLDDGEISAQAAEAVGIVPLAPAREAAEAPAFPAPTAAPPPTGGTG